MATSKNLTEEQKQVNRDRAKAWRLANPERERASKAKLRAKDPEKWNAQRLAASRRYYALHKDQVRAAANRDRAKWRAAVIEAYGCRCACPGCHVHHAELLTLDHVNGDGAEHRKTVGKSSRDIYRHVVNTGFPAEYQLLCGSCNLAKGSDAACPLAGEHH